MTQAETLVRQLQAAELQEAKPIDPALPLELARARREVDAAFAGIPDDSSWLESDLIAAGMKVVARWLKASGPG